MINKRNAFQFYKVFVKFRSSFHRLIATAARKTIVEQDITSFLSDKLNVSADKIKILFLKTPSIRNIDIGTVEDVLSVLDKHEINRSDLMECPRILKMKLARIDYHAGVLRECGLENLSLRDISSYMTIMNRQSVDKLKSSGRIPHNLDIQDRLANYFSMWPTSPPMTKIVSTDEPLIHLRMKILQRYFELILDCQPEIYNKNINLYKKVKNRPFKNIDLTLRYLKDVIKMPNKIIISNFFVLVADHRNFPIFLNDVKYLAGHNVKEILIKKPSILSSNPQTVLRIRNLLDDYNISKEAQSKCLDIFTLSFETVQERLKYIMSVPDLKPLRQHPRILHLLMKHKTVQDRLKFIKASQHKCINVNILSCYYNRTNHPYYVLPKCVKIKYVYNNLFIAFSGRYSYEQIKNKLQQHNFYVESSFEDVNYTLNELKKYFTLDDIFLNLQILLYPWNCIENYVKTFLKFEKSPSPFLNINFDKSEKYVTFKNLSKTQILNLVLYCTERQYRFSDIGMWTGQSLSNKNCE